MVKLFFDRLVFSFPEVHPKAKLSVACQRALRIPEDGEEYVLPTILGEFPLRSVDDFAEVIPERWRQHGGVMLPMYQSEALWLHFDIVLVEGLFRPYPFAVKIATAAGDAITGKDWRNGLHREPQDYVVAPRQPWIDGFCVGKGGIRQFVATPLRPDRNMEEQLEGSTGRGVLEITVYPMKPRAFEQRFPRSKDLDSPDSLKSQQSQCASPNIGPGYEGRLRQEICPDPYRLEEWDIEHSNRCFIHIANSLMWFAATNDAPPTSPLPLDHYTRYCLPWFDHYDDALALEGLPQLAQLKNALKVRQEIDRARRPKHKSMDIEEMLKIPNLQTKLVRQGNW